MLLTVPVGKSFLGWATVMMLAFLGRM